MSPQRVSASASKTVRLSLLQDFDLCADGLTVAVAPASQRLMCYLALQRTRVRRTVVSGSLWPESDEHHASASLRSALWRLPQLELVMATATHLRLNPDIAIDLHKVVDDALATLRHPPADGILVDLAHELIDIGDEILPGWYDDWVLVERDQFRQVRLQALDRIGERLADSGRWDDAFEVALAATRAEPLRESAHRLLVQVYLRQGNVAEAIRRYLAYSDLLRTEFNGRPSSAITDLLSPFLHTRWA